METKRIDQMTSRDYALDAFIAKKAEFDAMLTRLQTLSADHFYASPGEINWGHVGMVGAFNDALKCITDAAFKEGEHAE